MPRALLISAYDGASHARWRKGVVRHCDAFTWTAVTLPARHFSWRLRGNALSLLAPEHDDALSRRYDVILATSMTDVTTLKALRPALRAVPTVLYFHENQFAYPARDARLVDVALGSLMNALAADRVVFNSRFNRDSFLAGARALLSDMPDAVPPDLPGRVEARSNVLPVPLEAECFTARGPARPGAHPLTMVWNHRWEYDKAPERFQRALEVLAARGVPFRLHLLGQRFRQAPPALDAIRASFAAELVESGYIADPKQYRAVLAGADVVVSSALQDFQGLAVLDGMAAGCRPVVPDRLGYPEFVPAAYRYASWPDDPVREARALADRLADFGTERCDGWSAPPPDVRALSWDVLGSDYRALLKQAVSGRNDTAV